MLYYLNCWKPLKLVKLQRSHEIRASVKAAKAEKISPDDARLNPKRQDKNGQSAAKLRTGEGSTTIPLEGSTLKRVEVGKPKPQ